MGGRGGHSLRLIEFRPPLAEVGAAPGGAAGHSLAWITGVDAPRLWRDLAEGLDRRQ